MSKNRKTNWKLESHAAREMLSDSNGEYVPDLVKTVTEAVKSGKKAFVYVRPTGEIFCQYFENYPDDITNDQGVEICTVLDGEVLTGNGDTIEPTAELLGKAEAEARELLNILYTGREAIYAEWRAGHRA